MKVLAPRRNRLIAATPVRRAALAFAAGLTAIGMSLAVAAPASATHPYISIEKINSVTTVVNRTGYYDWLDRKDREVVVVAKFSNHKTNSVRFVSFQLCFYGPKTALISPYLRSSGPAKQTNSYPFRTFKPGTCHTFYDGQTWTKQRDDSVVWVVARITDGKFGNTWSPIAAFYRGYTGPPPCQIRNC